MKPEFRPGENIAIKVPPHEYDQTVRFYRDVLGFEVVPLPEAETADSIRFRFGDKTLWVDRVATVSQAEIWLEVVTDDVDGASEYLSEHGCARRDEIEALPEGFNAFWVASPSNIIHLVTRH